MLNVPSMPPAMDRIQVHEIGDSMRVRLMLVVVARVRTAGIRGDVALEKRTR
jgi:hypothetical protein